MSEQEIVIFFSCPGDMSEAKARLSEAVEELAHPFAGRGILVRAWRHEVDARPGLLRPGQSVQSIVDEQIPRNGVGDPAYHVYVGIMCKRFGTPTERAGSGTVHEFLDAKASFDRRGVPKVLFYMCRGATQEEGEAGSQLAAVQKFRSEYPGLFAIFDGTEDLLKQFRGHIIGELLDALSPPHPHQIEDTIRSREWVRGVEIALRQESQRNTFLDASAEAPRRILRRIEELAGVEQRLSGFEKEVLTAAAYLATIQSGTAGERTSQYLGPGALADATVAVLTEVERNGDGNSFGLPMACRCDVIAALILLGRHLDLDRRAIRNADGSWPSETANVREWLACLTIDAVATRGVVTYHLQVPNERWSEPLKGATSFAFEALWQKSRNVLTRAGISIAVARSHIQLNPDLERLPETVLARLRSAAVPISTLVPRTCHLGEAGWPELTELVPLPESRISSRVVFAFNQDLERRLVVDGRVEAALAAGEAGDLEVNAERLDSGVSHRCVLEADEGGGFEPRIETLISRISLAEQVMLDRALESEQRDEVVAVLSAFGLRNDLLTMLWETVRGGSASPEELIAVYRILRQAFELASANEDFSVFERRDKYLAAMDQVHELTRALEEVMI